ncbi:vitronectin a [Myripristis murdjan]|uniref:vitronectin a n=1 Tax=Myripristis murdjan TaxID=586833 RepID=UPI0011760CE3|nr:vitronectin [Myripristis murdjan]
MRLWAVLLLALLATAFAAEESCMGRCENGFDSQKNCQCDSMCKYYKSCCYDYEATCRMNTRGDTFVFAEDDDDFLDSSPTPAAGRQLNDESLPVSHHRPTPPHLFTPISSSKPRKLPSTTPEITTATEAPETITETVPVMQITPTAESATKTQKAPISQDPIKVPVTHAAPVTTTAPPTTTTTAAPDPDAETCSGRPFDSFMQLKNGSIYAFRGEYFFELDQKSVLPGYPKLIKDVWGISGPIDAAFTRVNCQGKTYIFKGNKYWRFDNGVLDPDYPRDITVGFDNIPDHLDAAFALPAPNHHGKEKVYFFKGDQYYLYEFLHQPSHEECITISETSPSMLFRRYTDMYYNNYEPFFSELFAGMPQHHSGHHFINRDWKGIKSPVDAVMAGRIYVGPWSPPPRRNDYRFDQQWGQQQGQQWNQQYGQQWDQQYGQQWGRRRQSRSPWEPMAAQGMAMGQGFAERGMEMGLRLAERGMEMEERLGRGWDRRWDQDWDQDRRRDGYRRYNNGNYDSRYNQRDDRAYWDFISRSQPLQSVYFFKGDKYYRVDLRTKRVDPAVPPYPRSIAKYWLGCSDTTGAEK